MNYQCSKLFKVKVITHTNKNKYVVFQQKKKKKKRKKERNWDHDEFRMELDLTKLDIQCLYIAFNFHNVQVCVCGSRQLAVVMLVAELIIVGHSVISMFQDMNTYLSRAKQVDII